MSISITRYYVAVLSIVIIFSTDCVFMCMCYIGEVFGYFCLFPKSSDADLSRKAFELQSSSLVIFHQDYFRPFLEESLMSWIWQSYC